MLRFTTGSSRELPAARDQARGPETDAAGAEPGPADFKNDAFAFTDRETVTSREDKFEVRIKKSETNSNALIGE